MTDSTNSGTQSSDDGDKPKNAVTTSTGREMHPNSLANLTSPVAGSHPNKGKSLSIGGTYKMWLNRMRDWTRDKIEQAHRSAKTGISQQLAARHLLIAADASDALALRAIDSLADRTDGKAAQHIKVDHNDTRTPEQLLADIQRRVYAKLNMEPPSRIVATVQPASLPASGDDGDATLDVQAAIPTADDV